MLCSVTELLLLRDYVSKLRGKSDRFFGRCSEFLKRDLTFPSVCMIGRLIDQHCICTCLTMQRAERAAARAKEEEEEEIRHAQAKKEKQYVLHVLAVLFSELQYKFWLYLDRVSPVVKYI